MKPRSNVTDMQNDTQEETMQISKNLALTCTENSKSFGHHNDSMNLSSPPTKQILCSAATEHDNA